MIIFVYILFREKGQLLLLARQLFFYKNELINKVIHRFCGQGCENRSLWPPTGMVFGLQMKRHGC